MTINDGTRAFVTALFEQIDYEVARRIGLDRLHRGTALYVLKQFALEVEKIDAHFGAELVATHCEEAVRSNGQTGERSLPMRVVCAYCESVIREAPGATRTSHGVCHPRCTAALRAFGRLPEQMSGLQAS